MSDTRHNVFYVKHRRWGAERLYYLSHSLWIRKLNRCALIVKYCGLFLFRAYIDPQARIGARLDLPHGGFGVVISPRTTIGDDAIIFHNVTIGNARPGEIRIGHRAYIGTGAVILGPVVIGDDVRIGAHAVVHHHVPDRATVVGPKARIVSRADIDEVAEE